MRVTFLLLLLGFGSRASAQLGVTLEHPAAHFWSGDAVRFKDAESIVLPSVSLQYTVNKNAGRLSYDFYSTSYETEPARLPAASFRRYSQISLEYLRTIFAQNRWNLAGSAGFTYRLQIDEMVFLSQPKPWEVILQSSHETSQWGNIFGLTGRYRIWRGVTGQLSLVHNFFWNAEAMRSVTSIKPGIGYTFGWRRKGFR